MRLAKIPETFGVYSIKHSAIAYLLSKGISEDVINQISRYSPGSTMVSKQYAVSQDQKNVYGFIADLVVKSEIHKDKDIDSSAHFTEFYGNENPEFVESKTINDSLPLQTFYNSANNDLVKANKITKRSADKWLGIKSEGFELYNDNNNTLNTSINNNLAVEKFERNIILIDVKNLEVVNNLLSHMGLSSLNK
jgi:hypothetical protein